MPITVTQSVNEINITVTQSGESITIQPVICTECDSFDGTIDGGTP